MEKSDCDLAGELCLIPLQVSISKEGIYQLT